MADDQLNRMLDSLEVDFDARIAREEEEAASDLALSLIQDVGLADSMERGSWALCLSGRLPEDVVEVGQDYVVTRGAILVPLARAVVTPAAAEPPLRSDTTLLERLRSHVRAGALVEVSAGHQQQRGRLARACVDHIALASAGEHPTEVLIALAAIDHVRLLSGPGGAG